MCYLLAPDLFDVDDEGRGSVIADPAMEGLVEQARVAIDRCPERAIRMETT
jgi:ferredoxin